MIKLKTLYSILIITVSLSLSNIQCGNSEHDFTLWIGGSPTEVDFWQSLVKQFNSQTGYNLQLVRQPTYTDQRMQQLVISLQAKQSDPDLFLMDVVWLDHFIASNWLEPLDQFIKNNNYQTSVLFQNILNSVDKHNGILYGLPVFNDVGLLYYRKDLLQKYGYDSPPHTWNELLTESLKIQAEERKNNSDFYGFVWQGAEYEGLICNFLEFVDSDSGIMRNGKIELNTPHNDMALNFMQDLIRKYKISPPNTYTEMKEEEVRRAFERGNVLFERNWTYAWKLHQDSTSPVKDKIGVTILPHFTGCESVSSLGGWHIGISRFSDNKNKAWEFIRYVTSFIQQKSLVLNVGWNPVRKDVYFDNEVNEKLPTVKILYDALHHAVARPELPYYSEVPVDLHLRFLSTLSNII